MIHLDRYIQLAFDASKDNILYIFKCDAQRKQSILCNGEKSTKPSAHSFKFYEWNGSNFLLLLSPHSHRNTHNDGVGEKSAER